MRIRILTAALTAAVTVAQAPAASASAVSFCGELAGDWDGHYCHMSVVSERKAVRDIKVAIPGDLVDHPTMGPVLRDYLRSLVNNWRTVGVHVVQDSFGEENFQLFQHGQILTVVFHEDYHADGPQPHNAYRTFTFDVVTGKRLQLSDLVNSNDALQAIASFGQPSIETALDQAAPPHNPRTYPFQVERWTPDKVYSGAYRAWALTPDELILYMPDYPVAHDIPIDYTPAVMQWSMDGGAVEAHIPLTALNPVLRPGFAA
jgi:hypothetical protein